MRKFIVSRFAIQSDKLNKEWNKTKMVVLSDLHNNSYGINLDDVYNTILMEKPDYIMIAGDMYTGEPGCANKIAEKFLKRLAKKFPVYYGLGNHEYRMMIYPEKYAGMYKEFEKMIKSSGINLLKNETVKLTRGDTTVAIHGLMIDRCFYKKLKRTLMEDNYVESVLGQADKADFNILLAHHPNYFKQYAGWGADLVFSGHVHGGMARIPFGPGVIAPNYRLFPKYDKGRFDEYGSIMILSAGIGTHTINLRPFNPPEIVVVTLNAVNEE